MPTIAKTKKYRDLERRHRKLIHLYSTMSELRLHTNKAVDPNLSKAYLNKVINNSPRFFIPVLESMRKYFYICLDSYIGAYIDNNRVKLSNNNDYSLAKYLYDGKRVSRKQSAKNAFEKMLRNNSSEISQLFKLRNSLAHYDNEKITSSKLIFSDSKTIEIINQLGDVLYLLGFRGRDKPHHFTYENNSAKEVWQIIDKLLGDDSEAQDYREKYIEKRKIWIR